METSDILVVLAVLLGTGGIASSIVALGKLASDKKLSEVNVQSAYVDIQAKVQESYGEIIEELREHISSLEVRIEKQQEVFTIELISQKTIVDDLKIRLGQTEQRLRVAEADNKKLAKRIDALEEENAKLIVENEALRRAV